MGDGRGSSLNSWALVTGTNVIPTIQTMAKLGNGYIHTRRVQDYLAKTAGLMFGIVAGVHLANGLHHRSFHVRRLAPGLACKGCFTHSDTIRIGALKSYQGDVKAVA